MLTATAADDTGVSALLTTAGTLLAAYGFFYTRVADDITGAVQRGRPDDPDNRRTVRADLARALRRGSLPLLAGAAAVVVVLIGGASSAITTAFPNVFRLSGPEGGLVLLTVFWIGLAAHQVSVTWRLAWRWWRWRS